MINDCNLIMFKPKNQGKIIDGRSKIFHLFPEAYFSRDYTLATKIYHEKICMGKK